MITPAAHLACAALIVLSLIGCRATEQPGADSPPQASENHVMPKHSQRSVPEDLMEKIVADVVQKSGAHERDIEVVRAEHVTWRDASLGCPKPNMGYAQVLSPGWWVILRVGREDFDYRASESGRFSRCTGATKRAPIRYPQDT